MAVASINAEDLVTLTHDYNYHLFYINLTAVSHNPVRALGCALSFCVLCVLVSQKRFPPNVYNALTNSCRHRIVHANPALYNFVHKHHHQDAYPIRGWLDTCNAHPTDFFYTGFSTSPISVLWLAPLVGLDVHIATIGVLLYSNMFVGALGHCRLDLDIGIFRTRFHAGHHAMFKYNYAQNIELWDRLFGTYKELPMPNKDNKKKA